MRTGKTFAILGVGLILACCVMIYLIMDLTLFPMEHKAKFSVNDNQWLHFENRLAKLEMDLNKHNEALSVFEKAAQNNVNAKPPPVHPVNVRNRTFPLKDSAEALPACHFEPEKVPQVDIQMLEMYAQLEFDNPDGGAWKQGWNIKYDEKQWSFNRKLRVFVVPHSHNDPGWLNTFEKYYESQTKNILNNMVSKLAENRNRKFIWAEISFFKLWWDEQSMATQDVVRQLIHDGQLEIVSGGWVMPDESVSHWTSQLTQLTEGHQWLKHNLDYIPNSGWAIDPFGLSPTMPYLLKGAGLENLLIQRVHYSVKKRLAKEKNLEFRWRQLWDNDGSTDFFTHVMPFYSYDVPHTCGPDPKVCCQFDFYRLPSFGLTCPWKVAPRAITDANVAERAALLLDQYRKKAQLFKTDVVLAPLGDDFRYTHVTEWDAQYGNYQKLFDYMNKNHQLNVQIQFGTLSQYFDAVREKRSLNDFPSLSGDFFTYSDRDDNYWSGYYTSRPFHKRLDRVLLGLLRNSETLAAIAWAKGNDQLAEKNVASRLDVARKWHALFQHHDGITGTARDNVVDDYAKKMILALNNSAHVLQQSIAHVLKIPPDTKIDPDVLYFSMDDIRRHYGNTLEKYVLTLRTGSRSKMIVLYNSLPRERTKVLSLTVSTPFIRVTDRRGQPVKCQISPVWIGPGAFSNAKYELSFLVTVPGFGITTYIVHPLHKQSLPREVETAKISVHNMDVVFMPLPGFSPIEALPVSQEFSISQRPELTASFGKSGLLKALRVGNVTYPVHLEFVKYGTRPPGKEQSGAYLFLPDKPEPDLLFLDVKPIIHVIIGPILSRVFVELPYLWHTCTLYNSPGADGLGLHIFNEVDISETQNYELAMRINTDISSGDVFYTDLNGLNMIKRRRFPKLPTQANYYPMAASAYIEDKKARLTIATAQPLGVASMANGQIEIMQDRRLVQDDNRGLGQGVTDNTITNHLFTLILENKSPSCSSSSTFSTRANHPAGMLSVAGHLALEELLYPVVTMHPQDSIRFDIQPYFAPLRRNLPVDLSVINLRVFPVPDGAGKGIGLVLHRPALDTCWGDNTLLQRFNVSGTGRFDLTDFLTYIEDWTVSKAPLTFHNVGPTLTSPIIVLCPHQITSILFHKTQS